MVRQFRLTRTKYISLGYTMKFEQFMESLNRTVPIRWNHSPSRDQGVFRVGSEEYHIQISKLNNESTLNVSFTGANADGEQSHSASGKGNELTVLATVIQGIRESIELYDPAKISFVANADVSSRKKLYDRMVKKFAKEENYKYIISGDNYTLVRDSKKHMSLPKHDDLSDAMLSPATVDDDLIMAVGFDSSDLSEKEIDILAAHPDLYGFTIGDQTWTDVMIPDGEQPSVAAIESVFNSIGLSSIIPKIKYYAN
ncbi:hypothetical protein VPHD483_0240 [Vibrio phage D483]